MQCAHALAIRLVILNNSRRPFGQGELQSMYGLGLVGVEGKDAAAPHLVKGGLPAVRLPLYACTAPGR